MPSLDIAWPLLIPLAALAFFGWRYLKSGSLVGALLGGRLKDTVGEISLPSRGAGSRVIRVSTFEPNDGGPLEVALAITSRTALSASVLPFKLSREEARQLAVLLQKAGGG
jgi:hypothetical protein